MLAEGAGHSVQTAHGHASKNTSGVPKKKMGSVPPELGEAPAASLIHTQCADAGTGGPETGLINHLNSLGPMTALEVLSDKTYERDRSFTC
jgi:hypothetical protein